MYEYYKISQKSRYALRALLQLALQNSQEPVGVRKLADTQDIPTRFLEVILSQLRQGGFVLSVRGKHGGYVLAKKPGQIPVGQIIRFVESIRQNDSGKPPRPQRIKAGDFSEKWLFTKTNASISDIMDKISLEDMVRQEQKCEAAYIGNYVI